MPEFTQSTTQEAPSKARLESVWSTDEEGNLTLTIVGGLNTLRNADLVESGSGKSASPANITVPTIYVTRADGTEMEFRSRVYIEHPLGRARKAQSF